MTGTVLSPVLVQNFRDNNGNPLFGGQLFTYEAGTTTPLATYTDSTGVTANANPTILNARGEANIWIPANTAYKFVLEDSVGNTIWTVDNVVEQQLITLYGGVDTGALNAYVLNFAAPFTTLVNGIVIYWIPSHTNTGPSSLNVNGLGIDSITNPDGSALKANAIVTGEPCQVMFYNGFWLLINANYFGGSVYIAGALTVNGALQVGNAASTGVTAYGTQAAAQVDMSPDSGSFTGNYSGFTGTQTAPVFWYRIGKIVLLTFEAQSGTSNATTFTLTNLPSYLQPATRSPLFMLPNNALEDNGASGFTAQASMIAASASISFSKNGSVNGWTNSGAKGFLTDVCIAYSLQ